MSAEGGSSGQEESSRRWPRNGTAAMRATSRWASWPTASRPPEAIACGSPPRWTWPGLGGREDRWWIAPN